MKNVLLFFFSQLVMKKSLYYIGFALLIIFAAIGLFLSAGYAAVRFGWTNSEGIVDEQRDDFIKGENLSWTETAEWITLKAAIIKDQNIINRAAKDAGVEPRLIVENLIGEQLRFFFDDRESYKKFFAPLKILGSETQFSWGVMGVKENTALQIEKNLTDRDSVFYLGSQYEHLLDFKTSASTSTSSSTPISQQRFVRMTDQHDHYWSYLYAGLYIHQIQNQWKAAGFNISDRADIIATLYNIGFANSTPNANPQSGGASIPVGDTTWSFGSLASSFYHSDELITEFPR